jgi:hypothetical protein
MLRYQSSQFFLAQVRLYKNSVRTSQETRHVSPTKTNRLMLFRETVAVCCENHMEHTDTLCALNEESVHAKAARAHSVTM